jgi:hypothetical protein
MSIVLSHCKQGGGEPFTRINRMKSYTTLRINTLFSLAKQSFAYPVPGGTVEVIVTPLALPPL